MKEKPILFSGSMVRAILDGRKTETRRVVKPQPEYIESSGRWGWPIPKSKVAKGCCTSVYSASREWWEYLLPEQMPYQVGDQLWVREKWSAAHVWDKHKPSEIPSCSRAGILYHASVDHYHPDFWGKIRPSIFMMRWMSRIDLEITGIRVERLQDISEEDAGAEGIQKFTKDGVGFKYGLDGWHWSCGTGSPYMCNTAKIAFETLWDSINGKTYPWASNPWVWVVKFRREAP